MGTSTLLSIDEAETYLYLNQGAHTWGAEVFDGVLAAANLTVEDIRRYFPYVATKENSVLLLLAWCADGTLPLCTIDTHGGADATMLFQGTDALKHIKEIGCDKLYIPRIALAELCKLNKPSTPVRKSEAVSSTKIISDFMLQNKLDEDSFKKRFREAKRYPGLLDCRASVGRGKKESRWYPDQIAMYLLDKKFINEKQAANILRKKYHDCDVCQTTADNLEGK